MASGFLQMFRYARAEKIDAKENFTTEALAANLRYDATPLLALLRRRGFIGEHARVADEVGVHTQVDHRGTGIIDLVVQLVVDGDACSFWVEVKVDAEEHGQQLTNYLTFLRGQPTTKLITLGKNPLRPDVQHLFWRELHDVASESAAPYWTDFAVFLKELGMVDDYDGPLAHDEVASLGATFALLRKTAHVLEPVCRQANLAWPKAAWPEAYDDIARMLGEQFRRFSRLAAFSRYPRSPVRVAFGLVPESRSANRGVLQTWVEVRPKDLVTRGVLLALLRERPLPSSWTTHKEGWAMLRARAEVPADGDPSSVQAWFLARLDELRAAELFTTATDLAVKAPALGDVNVDDG